MEALNALLNGEEPGYAKLQGEHFDYFMQAHSIISGRCSKKENVDLDISVLGGGMEISHRHARIFYDFQLRRFTLEVLGKHGCIVQGVLYLPGDGPVKLNSQDLLQIGQTKFTFSYQLALLRPLLLLNALLFHHNLCLHPLCGLPTLIHRMFVNILMVMIMAGTMVTMGLELALKR